MGEAQNAGSVQVTMDRKVAEFLTRYKCCNAPSICGASCRDTEESVALTAAGNAAAEALMADAPAVTTVAEGQRHLTALPSPTLSGVCAISGGFNGHPLCGGIGCECACHDNWNRRLGDEPTDANGGDHGG